MPQQQQRWSIAELAKVAGVTSRTLRHYDDIGLVRPAHVAANGWRYYEEPQLLRLQQVLLLRQLGLRLDTIAEVLDRTDGHDPATVLAHHRQWLVAEQERLGRLVQTVDRTIERVTATGGSSSGLFTEGGELMNAITMFEGFESNPYEEEARQRWGDDAVDATHARMRQWSADDAERARTGYGQVHEGLAPLLAEGVPVDDERVQDLVHLHHEVTCLFWTPDAEAYRGLGQGYVDDERFRRNIGQGNDALVTYLRDAMHVYADANLS